jgi:hypothetical protein
MQLHFTPGDGRARLLIGRRDAPVNVQPEQFATYTEGRQMGTGQQLGDGNFVLSTLPLNEVTIGGLDPNTTYHFAVFEYNGYNQPVYLTPAATFNATTTGEVPAKLLGWETRSAEKKVTLNWSTATGTNARYFVVERSGDGVIFSKVKQLKAVASGLETQYEARDARPLPGLSYYRLQVVDTAGSWEYSTTQAVLMGAEEKLTLLTNPVNTRLQLLSTLNSRVDWQMLSAGGQLIGRGVLQRGTNDIDALGLRPGSYSLDLYDGVEHKLISFTKY